MRKMIEGLLEFLLPRSETVKELETLTSEKLKTKVPKAPPILLPNTLAVFDYKNPLIKQAIWELKYRGNKKMATVLAECVFDELAEEIAEKNSLESFSEPILIPIPLSQKRKRERGWNQTEILALSLLQCGGANFFEVKNDILTKNRDTESQTKMNRVERLKNLCGCFEIKSPEKIAGQNIILLDDVSTTGATFEEARQTLMRAGVKKILAVAIAH